MITTLIIILISVSLSLAHIKTVIPLPSICFLEEEITDAVVANDQISEEVEWFLYHNEAYYDYFKEFTAIYNSLQYQRTESGYEIMRREGESKFIYCKKVSHV